MTPNAIDDSENSVRVSISGEIARSEFELGCFHQATQGKSRLTVNRQGKADESANLITAEAVTPCSTSPACCRPAKNFEVLCPRRHYRVFSRHARRWMLDEGRGFIPIDSISASSSTSSRSIWYRMPVFNVLDAQVLRSEAAMALMDQVRPYVVLR